MEKRENGQADTDSRNNGLNYTNFTHCDYRRPHAISNICRCSDMLVKGEKNPTIANERPKSIKPREHHNQEAIHRFIGILNRFTEVFGAPGDRWRASEHKKQKPRCSGRPKIFFRVIKCRNLMKSVKGEIKERKIHIYTQIHLTITYSLRVDQV